MIKAEGQIHAVSFAPGDILFNENEKSFHFFIIQEGSVEVYKEGANKTQIPLAVVGEGTSIGEFAMIDRLPRSATAKAMTEVKAVKVSDVAYNQLLEELPEWAVAVMRALVERLRQTNDIIRRSGIVDKKLRSEIDSIEYDPEATISDRNPLLGSDGPDDEI
jgi:CRP/FNR family transcriptional regulator, cyclic AMP receptor protein